MLAAYSYNFRFCTLTLTETDSLILRVQFDGIMPPYYLVKETEAIKNAAKQLNEYFAGKRVTFDVPYKFIFS